MLSDLTSQSEAVIACDPSRLSHEERERWIGKILPQLYKAVQEIQELPDGYAFRLPAKPEILLLVAEDLNMERLCCPFVRYTVEIEPNHGPFWLRFTGGDGVKAFVRVAFETSGLFDEEVAKAAGFSVAAQSPIASVATALEAVDTLNARYVKLTHSSDT